MFSEYNSLVFHFKERRNISWFEFKWVFTASNGSKSTLGLNRTNALHIISDSNVVSRGRFSWHGVRNTRGRFFGCQGDGSLDNFWEQAPWKTTFCGSKRNTLNTCCRKNPFYQPPWCFTKKASRRCQGDGSLDNYWTRTQGDGSFVLTKR